MKPKDIFILVIRVLGLVFLYHGLSALVPLLFSAAILPFAVSALMVVWQLLLAYWLLRGAPLLMRIAYPETTGRSPKASSPFLE